MGTINAFDKSNLTTIRTDIEEALKSVQDKHGIQLNLGRINYSPDHFTCSMEAHALDAELGVSKQLASVMKLHGLQVEKKGMKLVDYHPNRRKYPFVYQQGGGLYKCDLQKAKAIFGK